MHGKFCCLFRVTISDQSMYCAAMVCLVENWKSAKLTRTNPSTLEASVQAVCFYLYPLLETRLRLRQTTSRANSFSNVLSLSYVALVVSEGAMRLHEETGAARSGVSLSWALFVHPYRQERSSLPLYCTCTSNCRDSLTESDPAAALVLRFVCPVPRFLVYDDASMML